MGAVVVVVVVAAGNEHSCEDTTPALSWFKWGLFKFTKPPKLEREHQSKIMERY